MTKSNFVVSSAFRCGLLLLAITAPGAPAVQAAATDYRFELAAPPKPVGGGRNLVSVRIVHLPDARPVAGAIIIQYRADMGPGGMADMTAPMKPAPAAAPGQYSFEVQTGGAMSTPDKWALRFAAKVQGEPATVRGVVVVELKP